MTPNRLLVRGAALVAAVVALLGGAGWAEAAGPSGTISDVTTTAGTLHVTLTASGLPAGAALVPSSVVVTVDGSPVTATVASSSTTGTKQPRRVAVIAVDTSGSMAGAKLLAAKQAATRFVADVPSDVLVGVVSFSDRARVALAPTTDRNAVRAALAGLHAGGNTTLYDALTLAVAQLGRSGQRLLVVLSDGADTSSHTSLAAATALVRHSGAAVRLLGYRTDPTQTATLAQLARDVGGRLVPVTDAGQLLDAFGGAAGVFATQVDLDVVLPQGLSGGAHGVAVTATFGATRFTEHSTFTVAAPVTAGGTPRSTPPTAIARLAAAPVSLVLLVFAALLLLFLAVLVPRRVTESRRSLQSLDPYALGAYRRPTAQTPAGPTSLAQTAVGVGERYVQSRGTQDRLALQLDRANLRFRPAEWVLLRCGIGVAAVFVLSLLLGNVLIGLVGGVALTWLGTYLYLKRRVHKRLRTFEAQLPNTLQLVASSLKTGFSLPQAIDAAAGDGQQPMSSELSRALAEARLGAPLEDGLDRVADRMQSQDLRWAVMAIRIQRQVGGNLAEVLLTTANTIRERAALRRHVQALSAEGRLSAYILVALPILLAIYLFFTRRSYLSLLWTTKIGVVMIVAAVVGFVLGGFWMRKTIRVEV